MNNERLKRRIERLARGRVAPEKFKQGVEEAFLSAVIWMEDNERNGISRSSLHSLCRETFAEVQRSKPSEDKRKRKVVPVLGTMLKRSPFKALEIARQLGERHLQVAKLRLEGKKIGEIAKEMKLSESSIAILSSAIKYHVQYYKETGALPVRRNPTQANVKKAAELTEMHFPSLSGNYMRRMHRAVALGLEGVLPFDANNISILLQMVEKNPELFNETMRSFLENRKTPTKHAQAVWDRIKEAAKRRDRTALKWTNGIRSGVAVAYLRALQNGTGINARHPDLFTGTIYPPSIVREPHVDALRSRAQVIKQLKQRGEKIGAILAGKLRGETNRQIARSLGLTPKTIIPYVEAGTHALFGVEPRSTRTFLLYNALRFRHPDLFGKN